MAIAGGGIPSMLVRIRDGKLIVVSGTTNVPSYVVQCDMVLAAEALRADSTKTLRIDALRFRNLQDYLRNSGHIK